MVLCSPCMESLIDFVIVRSGKRVDILFNIYLVGDYLLMICTDFELLIPNAEFQY